MSLLCPPWPQRFRGGWGQTCRQWGSWRCPSRAASGSTPFGKAPRPGGQLLLAGEELGRLLPMSAGAEAGLGRAFLVLGPRGPGHGWEAVVLHMVQPCQDGVHGSCPMRQAVVGCQGWVHDVLRHAVGD